MTEKKFRKFASNLDGSKFRDLAEAAVDFDCRNFDGTKIVGTARDNLIEALSLDYQTGSNYLFFSSSFFHILSSFKYHLFFC